MLLRWRLIIIIAVTIWFAITIVLFVNVLHESFLDVDDINIGTEKDDMYDLFDQVYFLTLPSRETNVHAFASSLGFTPRIMRAVDGRTLDLEALVRDRQVTSQFAVDNERNPIACGLSHVLAAQQLLSSHDEHVVIFEDDVTPIDAPEYISNQPNLTKAKVLKSLAAASSFVRSTQEYDIFYLGWCGISNCNESLIPINSFVSRMRHSPACTHAYIMSRTGAQKLLSSLPLQKTIDLHFSTVQFQCFCLTRPIFTQFRSKHNSTLMSVIDEIQRTMKFCYDKPEYGAAFV